MTIAHRELADGTAMELQRMRLGASDGGQRRANL